MTELRVDVPDELLDEIAERAAAIVLGRLAADQGRSASPYMTIAEAAELLRAKRQRVYDLLSAGRLSRFKDGSRVLVLREELEAMLAGEVVRDVAHRLPPASRPGKTPALRRVGG